jgi:DNA-binding phage protein
VPTLKLTGGKPASTTRSKPASTSKPAAKRTASKAPARKQAQARKPAATASENGSQTRGPKLPEGWTKSDFNRVVKDMQKAKAAREKAEQALKDAQADANTMALDLIAEGIQMSVVSKELDLSRQWLYKIMEDNDVKTVRQQAARKPARRTAKPAAKKAAAAKPAARKAPARKPPAAKKTARTAPATSKRTAPRGRVRLAA